MIDRLGGPDSGVTDVKTESLRGNPPSVQFTFTFQWGGAANGN